MKSIQEAISEVISEKFNIDTSRSSQEIASTSIEGITKEEKRFTTLRMKLIH